MQRLVTWITLSSMGAWGFNFVSVITHTLSSICFTSPISSHKMVNLSQGYLKGTNDVVWFTCKTPKSLFRRCQVILSKCTSFLYASGQRSSNPVILEVKPPLGVLALVWQVLKLETGSLSLVDLVLNKGHNLCCLTCLHCLTDAPGKCPSTPGCPAPSLSWRCTLSPGQVRDSVSIPMLSVVTDYFWWKKQSKGNRNLDKQLGTTRDAYCQMPNLSPSASLTPTSFCAFESSQALYSPLLP